MTVQLSPRQQLVNPYPAIAFGGREWIQYGLGDPGKEPLLPPNIHEILQGPCPFWPRKTVEETHLLVLLPRTVSRKVNDSRVIVPITLKTINELVRSAGGVGYRGFQDKVLEAHGNKAVGRSRWVLITKNIVPWSKNLSHAPFEKPKSAGYETLDLLSAAICILVENLRSGQRLFGNNPWTYAQCPESIEGPPLAVKRRQLAVGGFSPDGLDITDDLYPTDDVDLGFAGLLRLTQ